MPGAPRETPAARPGLVAEACHCAAARAELARVLEGFVVRTAAAWTRFESSTREDLAQELRTLLIDPCPPNGKAPAAQYAVARCPTDTDKYGRPGGQLMRVKRYLRDYARTRAAELRGHGFAGAGLGRTTETRRRRAVRMLDSGASELEVCARLDITPDGLRQLLMRVTACRDGDAALRDTAIGGSAEELIDHERAVRDIRQLLAAGQRKEAMKKYGKDLVNAVDDFFDGT